MRTELAQGAWLELQESWLPLSEAEALQRALSVALSWEQRHIVLFGKQILQPRLIAWAGALPYRYSGQTLEPRAWPAELSQIDDVCARVAAAAGAPFNHVLINRYRDGNDSMGYHADAEPELGADPLVATLSLGQTRRFLLRPERSAGKPAEAGKQRTLSWQLTNGSLLVMGGTCQRHYRHAIAKGGTGDAAALLGERLSLTFRQLLRAPR